MYDSPGASLPRPRRRPSTPARPASRSTATTLATAEARWPIAQYTHTTSRPRWLTMVSMAMEVLPVCRSPRISSRWPRPIGMSASMTFRPVCSGTVTGARSMIAGAGRSIGMRCSPSMGGSPSSGRPSGSMTRPSRPRPRRHPSRGPRAGPRRRRAAAHGRRAAPRRPRSRRRRRPGPAGHPGIGSSRRRRRPAGPPTWATPVATESTVPTSRATSAGAKAWRARSIAAKASSKPCCRASSAAVMASGVAIGWPAGCGPGRARASRVVGRGRRQRAPRAACSAPAPSAGRSPPARAKRDSRRCVQANFWPCAMSSMPPPGPAPVS